MGKGRSGPRHALRERARKMALSRCTGVLVGALRRAAGASAGGLAESFLPRQLSSKVSVDLVIPTTNSQGAAFPEDLRSTSGLGKGDGKETHTSKWLSEGVGPMEMINSVPPIASASKIVACRGGQDQLGHPVEFIKVYGTTLEEPACCKYCGLRYCYDGHH